MMNGKHRFAFFASLEGVEKVRDAFFSIKDEQLCKRISVVLRMKAGDIATLFDSCDQVEVAIESISKREVVCRIVEYKKIDRFVPEITVLLPLLKRDALEDAVTRLTLLGVTTIQLLVSEKSRRSITEKEHDRLTKMMVAAAEQSKQFALPQLKRAISVVDSFEQYPQENRFLFDQHGSSVRELVQKKYKKPITLAFGPEGDFTDQEKNLLKEHNFTALVLTKSILRTIDAVLLGVGLFRLD